MDEVVPSGKNHQTYYQAEANSETVFDGPGRQRATAQRFQAIKHQMAAIQHWNWEQINKS
jgi:hypothetical protein